jgi:GNAT superfamily N-acetyltransferase
VIDVTIIEPRAGLGADCARLLATLAEWFGLPEENAAYVAHVDAHPTWSAVDGAGTVVGLLDVVPRFPETHEIHIMLVDRSVRGAGIGTALLDAAEAALREAGVRLLTVKTLGPSDPDRNYAETRAFYLAKGFLPIEETDRVWGPDNPAIILVKPLRVPSG